MLNNDRQEYNEFNAQIIQEDETNVLKALTNAVVSLQRRVDALESLGKDNVEIKIDTGDYGAGTSWDGRRVINLFDTNYKIFADGAWRQIVNW